MRAPSFSSPLRAVGGPSVQGVGDSFDGEDDGEDTNHVELPGINFPGSDGTGFPGLPGDGEDIVFPGSDGTGFPGLPSEGGYFPTIGDGSHTSGPLEEAPTEGGGGFDWGWVQTGIGLGIQLGGGFLNGLLNGDNADGNPSGSPSSHTPADASHQAGAGSTSSGGSNSSGIGMLALATVAILALSGKRNRR